MKKVLEILTFRTYMYRTLGVCNTLYEGINWYCDIF